ncbi:Hypothetical protein, putative [Bodo saltans]|uniref:Helicase C-terminal domain-containing protein n=1 Tax=Bodo saltans TaxID=75058 RepID=A0A0S4JHK1_BODSA|nr:Hypothetical protein, putative [Bodo saltans]|eukprot:CUG88923.1 Hypothetical protein, putative [Bodo saltans]
MSKKETISFEAVGVHPAIWGALADKGISRTLELQQKTLLHTVNDFADVIAEAPSHSGRHTLLSVFAAHCILTGEQPKRNVLIVTNSSATSSKLVSTFHHLLSATKIPVVPCLEERPPKIPGTGPQPTGAVLVGTLATFAKWQPDHFASTITLIVEDCSVHDEKQLHATIEAVIGVAPTTNLFFLSSTPPSEISVSIRYLFRRTNRRYYFAESDQPHFSYIMCHDGDDRNELNERLATVKGFKNILILTHNREVRELKAHLHQRLGIKTFSIQRNTTGPDHDRVLGEFLRSPYAILVAMDAYTGVDLMDLDAVIQFYPPQKSMPEEEWADFVSFLQLTGDPRRPTTIITLVAPDDFSLVSYFMRRVNAEGPVINVSPQHPQFAAAILHPQVAALEKMRLENGGSVPPPTLNGGSGDSPMTSTLVSPSTATTTTTITNAAGVSLSLGRAAPPPLNNNQKFGGNNNNNNGSKTTSPIVNAKDQLTFGASGDVPLPRSAQRVEPPQQQQKGQYNKHNNNNNKQQQGNNNGKNNNNNQQQQQQMGSSNNKQQQQQQQQPPNKQPNNNNGGKNNNSNANNKAQQQQQQQGPAQSQQGSNNNVPPPSSAGNAAYANKNNNNNSKNRQ